METPATELLLAIGLDRNQTTKIEHWCELLCALDQQIAADADTPQLLDAAWLADAGRAANPGFSLESVELQRLVETLTASADADTVRRLIPDLVQRQDATTLLGEYKRLLDAKALRHATSSAEHTDQPETNDWIWSPKHGRYYRHNDSGWEWEPEPEAISDEPPTNHELRGAAPDRYDNSKELAELEAAINRAREWRM